jgi:hypothetical protein
MGQVNTDLIPVLRRSMEMDLPEGISMDELKEKIGILINEMIQHDFQKLVAILYRIDVSEAKLKYLLKENSGEDAGKLIAELIIERQTEKIKFRQENKPDEDISDNEKW